MKVKLILDIPEAEDVSRCRELLRLFVQERQTHALVDVKILDFEFLKEPRPWEKSVIEHIAPFAKKFNWDGATEFWIDEDDSIFQMLTLGVRLRGEPHKKALEHFGGFMKKGAKKKRHSPKVRPMSSFSPC